jgi:AAA+ superfamily predicted ATPase
MRSTGTTQAYIADDNWNYLREELRRLDARLELEISKRRNPELANPLGQFQGLVISDEEVADLLASPPGEPPSAPEAQLSETRSSSGHVFLPRLVRLFGLSHFEEWCVLLCLAPELDRKYERLYAYLQDDLSQKKPRVDLALKLAGASGPERLAARSAFEPAAPLVKHRLLQVGGELEEERAPLLSRTLKLDDRVVNYLLGLQHLDRRIAPMAYIEFPGDAAPSSPAPESRQRQLREFLARHAASRVLIHFHGPDGSGKESLARTACAEAGQPVILIDASRWAASSIPFEDLAIAWGREALLQQAALCLTNVDSLFQDAAQRRPNLERLIDTLCGMSQLTFFVGERCWRPARVPDGLLMMEMEFSLPAYPARQLLWQTELERSGAAAHGVDVRALANRFRFGARQIREIAAAATNAALWRPDPEAAVTMDDIYSAARALANPKLGGLATRVTCRRGWDDMVLPPDQTEQLREICSQAEHRHRVYAEWGFDRKLAGEGIHVIFAGPPGTGKTMAAEVIAGALHLDLYKVDLSQVVSKYIGETEKNLHLIFEEARAANVVLFFDEADALFGKRSEVKDAHDRFANIEISYLLQKMDEYEGVVVLATNLRQHLDEAFLRRMHNIVEFPFPDEDLRRRIWQAIFPPEAPLAPDVDMAALAREVKLAGGNIRNIALAAAFYAAEADGAITMDHIWSATRREHQKLGRSWARGSA